ncbi:flavodoxin [Actinokineospora sp. NBRC 105648]|nr:flavodoxin [Actinokineospora sp. NBRC 105648]
MLVTYASKMGATKEIADVIGAELVARELTVDVVAVGAVRSLRDYDAVVLGSAVYAGRWLRPAGRFVHAHADELERREVWLFESGWVGKRPVAVTATRGGRARAAKIGAAVPTVFGGRLDPALAKGFLDRALARRMPGDARDWDRIRSWAQRIAVAAHRSADSHGD